MDGYSEVIVDTMPSSFGASFESPPSIDFSGPPTAESWLSGASPGIEFIQEPPPNIFELPLAPTEEFQEPIELQPLEPQETILENPIEQTIDPISDLFARLVESKLMVDVYNPPLQSEAEIEASIGFDITEIPLESNEIEIDYEWNPKINVEPLLPENYIEEISSEFEIGEEPLQEVIEINPEEISDNKKQEIIIEKVDSVREKLENLEELIVQIQNQDSIEKTARERNLEELKNINNNPNNKVYVYQREIVDGAYIESTKVSKDQSSKDEVEAKVKIEQQEDFEEPQQLEEPKIIEEIKEEFTLQVVIDELATPEQIEQINEACEKIEVVFELVELAGIPILEAYNQAIPIFYEACLNAQVNTACINVITSLGYILPMLYQDEGKSIIQIEQGGEDQTVSSDLTGLTTIYELGGAIAVDYSASVVAGASTDKQEMIEALNKGNIRVSKELETLTTQRTSSLDLALAGTYNAQKLPDETSGFNEMEI